MAQSAGLPSHSGAHGGVKVRVQEALQLLHQALAGHSETAVLDAQTALATLMERPRAWVLAHPEALLSPQQAERLYAWAVRLARGEPLPYVLGEWPFFGRRFYVTRDVLIPRPETETLVEAVLAQLPASSPLRVVDVGTGSGCIALTLALERPRWQVWATELSWGALQVARRNRERYGLGRRVRLLQADLLGPLGGGWDAVVANLPYIKTGVLAFLRVAKWEPRLALDGGPDGMGLLRRLVVQAGPRLRPGGILAMEISPEQAQPMQELLIRLGRWSHVQILPDISGRPRVLWAERK